MPLQEDPEVTLGALRWAMDHLHRPGDVIHIVHVIKCLVHKLEVFHGQSVPLFSPPTSLNSWEALQPLLFYAEADMRQNISLSQCPLQACQEPPFHSTILARHTVSRKTWPEPRRSYSAGKPQSGPQMFGVDGFHLTDEVDLALRCSRGAQYHPRLLHMAIAMPLQV